MDLQEMLNEARQLYVDNKPEAYDKYKQLYLQYPTEPEVWNGLGNCYDVGTGVTKNQEEAMSFYKMAAEAGNASSMYNLALGYEMQENPECIEWYEKAFEAGDSEAAYRLSVVYNEDTIVSRDGALRISWLKKAAEKGFSSAELDLGAAYMLGEDVEVDFQEVVYWLKKAYEHGEGLAARNLSIYYGSGKGEPVDLQQSVDWAVKAAKCSEPDTELCTDAAVNYLLGENSFPKNINKAVELYEISAANGDATAIEDLAVIYSNPEYGAPQDEPRALELFEKGALKGREKSIVNYKELCRKLYGEEGQKHFLNVMEKAAGDGNYKACVECYLCYLNGRGTEKNEKKALEYLDYAVKGNYPEALIQCGGIYNDGRCGVKKDERKAIEYFQKAADLGDITGSYLAGICYKEQYDITKNGEDKKKGLEYLKKAAEAGHMDAMYDYAKALWDTVYDSPADFAQYDTRKKEATEWKKKAAEAGHAHAIFDLAFDAYIDEDEQEAFKWLKMGENQKVYACYTLLGDIYAEGSLNQPKDEARAFQYYLSAEDGGKNVRAALQTGRCYYFGKGTQKDYEKALKYLQIAADHGKAEAKYLLGCMYEDGEGVIQNRSKAISLFQEFVEDPLVSEKSKNQANLQIARNYAAMGQGSKAISCYNEIIQSSDDKELAGECYFGIGYLYAKGIGVSEDLPLAKTYFEKAIECGAELESSRNNLEYIQNELQRRTISYTPTKKKQGCYIATCVYGTYDCPEVWTLRRFRDTVLDASWYGRLFIRLYYAVSPSLVKWFGNTAVFKKVWKNQLDRLISRLRKEGLSDKPYQDPCGRGMSLK